MQAMSEFAIAIIYWSIALIYPIVAVFRGRSIGDSTAISWGLQVVYFIGLCFGIPAIGGCISPDIRRRLLDLMPESPILGAIIVLGWVAPFLSGSVASFLRWILTSNVNDTRD